MPKHSDAAEIIKRLKRVEGQVRGLIRMIEEEKACEDIMIQIGSTKAALHKVGQCVLEGHLHHCVLEGIRNGNGEEILDKLSRALEQFSRLS